jgi:predicted DsbA family dithiol-disulfide isomerase
MPGDETPWENRERQASERSTAMPLTVEMWGDLQCVWCYVEFAALRIAARTAGDIDCRFRTYSLHRDTRSDTVPNNSVAGAGAFHAGILKAAAEVGVDLHAAVPHATDSQKAHELVHLAGAYGMPLHVVGKLFEAHFVRHDDIGSTEVLVDLAADCGLDRQMAAEALDSGAYTAAVEQDNHLAYLFGVSQVPFAVINRKYTLTGVQTMGTVDKALALVRSAQGAPL